MRLTTLMNTDPFERIQKEEAHLEDALGVTTDPDYQYEDTAIIGN